MCFIMCLILQSAARSTFNPTRTIVGNARLRSLPPLPLPLCVCMCVYVCEWALC